MSVFAHPIQCKIRNKSDIYLSSYIFAVQPFLLLHKNVLSNKHQILSCHFLKYRDVALCIVTSPKWKSALRWRSKNDKFAERTPLKLLISQMPGLLLCVCYS